MKGTSPERNRSIVALLLALVGGAMLVVCDNLTLQAPALLVVWSASMLGRVGSSRSSARQLIPIAVSAFGVAFLSTLVGTSSALGLRDALGTANVALIEALPLRLAILLVALGPLVLMIPSTFGGVMPLDPRRGVLDDLRAALTWWVGWAVLMRLLFGVLPPLMQGLRLETILPLAGGALALAGGVLAFSAQTGTRLVASMVLLRTGTLLAGGSSFENDVFGALSASALLDGLAFIVALAAVRRLSATVGGEWIEGWEGVGLIDRGPALALALSLGVLAAVPGTVGGISLLMQSRAVVAAGQIAGPVVLALAWTLGVVALLRVVRTLYLRPPQIALQQQTRRWRAGYILPGVLLVLLATPPLATFTYYAGRALVAALLDAVHPQPPSPTSSTQ